MKLNKLVGLIGATIISLTSIETSVYAEKSAEYFTSLNDLQQKINKYNSSKNHRMFSGYNSSKNPRIEYVDLDGDEDKDVILSFEEEGDHSEIRNYIFENRIPRKK